MKRYLVNTPLILQNENGEDVRVARGEIIELSDAQYAEVAAHVTLWTTSEQGKQPENSQENQTETPAETADKPKRGKAKGAE